eukprot:snap_masked-scaffold_36-processed-gene-2.94-mRNA-1 protein AED:1.00 eAED:1.00 QI:0/0/0/0/1/1/4/0/91
MRGCGVFSRPIASTSFASNMFGEVFYSVYDRVFKLKRLFVASSMLVMRLRRYSVLVALIKLRWYRMVLFATLGNLFKNIKGGHLKQKAKTK